MGGGVDVVRLLMEGGVGVDGVDSSWNTALFHASWSGCVDVVRVLVEEGGADVNKAGEEGRTPLCEATAEGREDVVRVLLELGADARIPDERGETALDVARWLGWDGIVEVLESWGGG